MVRSFLFFLMGLITLGIANAIQAMEAKALPIIKDIDYNITDKLFDRFLKKDSSEIFDEILLSDGIKTKSDRILYRLSDAMAKQLFITQYKRIYNLKNTPNPQNKKALKRDDFLNKFHSFAIIALKEEFKIFFDQLTDLSYEAFVNINKNDLRKTSLWKLLNTAYTLNDTEFIKLAAQSLNSIDTQYRDSIARLTTEHILLKND